MWAAIRNFFQRGAKGNRLGRNRLSVCLSMNISPCGRDVFTPTI